MCGRRGRKTVRGVGEGDRPGERCQRYEMSQTLTHTHTHTHACTHPPLARTFWKSEDMELNLVLVE